jgi:2-phospho-L-lactate/phosphoenolpyruvate guanylyltransferase
VQSASRRGLSPNVDGVRWTAVVPIRAMPSAKTRLARDLSVAQHALLVDAIRADTLTTIRAADEVARVVIVADKDGPGITLVQRSPGLNGALRDAWAYATQRWPDEGVVALVGDLPALRPGELTAALGQASEWPRSFVRDADGTGTTLLAVTHATPLDPRFGTGSAVRHAGSGAVAVDAGPGLRQDVDTIEDLAAAVALGVGERTASVFGSALRAQRSRSRGMMAP